MTVVNLIDASASNSQLHLNFRWRMMHSEALWIFLYFLANLTLTIHNKWVLQKLHFTFPWLLTAIHIGVSGAGSYVLCQMFTIGEDGRKRSLTQVEWAKLLGFSILYAINIAISNVSLNYVSLAFHQIVRSSTPAVTLLMEYVCFGKRQSYLVVLSLIPIIIGISLASLHGLYSFEFGMLGFGLTFLGVLLSAIKGIVTNVLMVGPLQLHPLEVIWRMSLPSVIQCLLYSFTFGELTKVGSFLSGSWALGTFFDIYSKLLFNGFLAFALNWVSFGANKRTSALTMSVAGNVKQALSIILGIYIFRTSVNRLNSVGILATLIGGAWYSSLTLKRKQSESNSKDKNDGEYLPIHSTSSMGSSSNPIIIKQ